MGGIDTENSTVSGTFCVDPNKFTSKCSCPTGMKYEIAASGGVPIAGHPKNTLQYICYNGAKADEETIVGGFYVYDHIHLKLKRVYLDSQDIQQ